MDRLPDDLTTLDAAEPLVLAAAGDGWALYWPAAAFEALTDDDRAALALAQLELMVQNDTK